jgi:chloramphenicol O-acetyltransferase type B
MPIKTFGQHSYDRPTLLWDNPNTNVYIGKYCSIALEVKIMVCPNHRADWISTFPHRVFFKNAYVENGAATKGDVHIGNDVWIGYDALVMSGVIIGDGAIVGSRTVVTKNIPPYHVMAGNPGRIIKKRFTIEEIEILTKMKWWDWPEEHIQNNYLVLQSNRIIELYQYYKAHIQ